MYHYLFRGIPFLIALCVLSGCQSSHSPIFHSTEETNTTTAANTTVWEMPTAFLMDNIPPLCQFPDFPTGCESVSAVMALRHAGEDLSPATFIDEYLPTDNNFRKEEGKVYGPDPYEVFVGDPRTEESFGCMAPVIQNAVNAYFGNENHTTNTTGTALSALCRDYVSQGTPVLIWVTMHMREVGDRSSWYTPSGERYVWPSNEHCVVLVGYDETTYSFNDPLTGTRVRYRRALVEERYQALGCQSLVITGKG